MTFQDVFSVTKPIMGMIHLAGHGENETLEQAKREIELLYTSGVDAVLVENYFGSTQDVARTLQYLSVHYAGHPYGVNVLGDFEKGCELARLYGATFVQVDSICGHLPAGADQAWAQEVAALRGAGEDFLLMGGVRFKYQPVASGRSLEEDLALGMDRCDAIVVTGSGTAQNTDIAKIRNFREIMGDFPLIVGAGMTDETCVEQLSIADGAIVGSYFKRDGRTEMEVDPQRVKRFMARVMEARASAK